MEKNYCTCLSGKTICDCKQESGTPSSNSIMENELIKQLAELNDKYQEVKAENERLKEQVELQKINYINLSNKFNH